MHCFVEMPTSYLFVGHLALGCQQNSESYVIRLDIHVWCVLLA